MRLFHTHVVIRLMVIWGFVVGLSAFFLSPVLGASVLANDPQVEHPPLNSAAPASDRTVGNGCTYATMGAALAAAQPGDRLLLEGGRIFTENLPITKSLVLQGGYNGCSSGLSTNTTINGGGTNSVFVITDTVVSLRNLNITNGNGGNGGGLKVIGSSRVTLSNTDVFNNQATNGGGLYLSSASVLTLTNDSDITNNTATSNGGGARVWGKLVGIDWFSQIANNTAPRGGGVSVQNGVLDFRGSHVMNNEATAADSCGGGISAGDSVITMTDSSNVALNSAYNGGGICADNTEVHLGAVIHSNTAANNGGGVYLADGSVLYATSTGIGDDLTGRGNKATTGSGGGFYVEDSEVEFSGSIYNNDAGTQGGGMYARSSTVNLTDAQIGNTGALQANRVMSGVFGAGLYFSATQALLSNTGVASNTFSSGAGWGAGITAWDGSVLTLTNNSRIAYHYAPNAWIFGGGGAGILLRNSSATLSNSQVLSNAANLEGAGVLLVQTSTLTIRGSSIIAYNRVITGSGGGIAATDDPDISISNSALHHNIAGTNGGAIYLEGGTLDLGGWWEVRDNTAGGNGGAVAVTGTGDAGFYVDTAASSLSNNQTDGNGGALYVDNASTLELFADDGSALNFSSNLANLNGGGAFANGGALFNVYGKVTITDNEADNGGAFYLSGGSRLWLDDKDNDKPLLLANRAGEEGGAIYAQNGSSVECAGARFGDAPEGNVAMDGSGGAIYLGGSALESDNCIFYNNQATASGGAIAAYTSTLNIHVTYPTHALALSAGREPLAPQALWATTCNPLSQECSAFYGNIADSDTDTTGDGGAIYSNGSVMNVRFTHMYRNRARYGGAIYQNSSNAATQVVNTLVYSNTSNSGALHRNGGVFTVTHSTLANNLVGAGFAGMATVVSNTIAWGNTAGGFMITPTLTTCNIDQSTKAGVNADPLFVAPGAGQNYHLAHNSPAIDACATGEWLDLDNNLRPVGAAYDMGAYEGEGVRQIYLPLILR